MSRIKISDMTMRCTGKSEGGKMSFREKLELVKLLDRLGVSVIEVSPIVNAKIDRLLIKSISSAVRESAVAVSVGLTEEYIDLAWAALEEAKHPRLQIAAPVSAVQMEYLLGKKPAAVLESVKALVARARALCEDVEFIADDATRSDSAFLYEIVDAAIAAGASTVTLCDAAGQMLPDQFADFLGDVYAHVPALRDVTLGVACKNDLSMADSCAVAAIRSGAREVKCAAFGDGVVSLETMAKVLSARGDSFGVDCTIRTTQMKRLLEQIRRMCSTERSSTSPFDSGVQSIEEFSLTVHDDMGAVLSAVARLGYELSEEDAAAYRSKFEAKLRKLISDSGVEPDTSLVLTECAIYADRAAIDEEIVRLSCHFGAFREILAADEPVGRKLDFLLQEINRETNTIGSKSASVGIASLVVEIKSELEKIREQIQNIE